MELGTFNNKRVLVTGASSGIGAAVAEAFLAKGAHLCILADAEQVYSVAEKMSAKHGRPVQAIHCGIADPQMVQEALKSLSCIDVLMNNAGLERITPIDDLGDDIAKRIIDINVTGTCYVTRSVLPKMAAGRRIVLTSSIWGKIAVAGFSAYCASKHANLRFMRAMAHELVPRGITVDAVCPGWARTDAALRSLEAMAERKAVSEQALLAEIVANQAIGGLLEPQDIVAPYLFLVSDMAADITGQALNIDRGEVMH